MKKWNTNDLKSVLAVRATGATGEKFYKSYIKEIKLVEERFIPGHVSGWTEKDYFFEYKGKEYRVNEHICPNKDGEVKYSAKYRYETIQL